MSVKRVRDVYFKVLRDDDDEHLLAACDDIEGFRRNKRVRIDTVNNLLEDLAEFKPKQVYLVDPTTRNPSYLATHHMGLIQQSAEGTEVQLVLVKPQGSTSASSAGMRALEEKMDQTMAELEVMKLQHYRATQTAQHEADIGKFYLDRAREVSGAGVLPDLCEEQLAAVQAALDQILPILHKEPSDKRSSSSSSRGIAPNNFREAVLLKAEGSESLKEADYMQPVAMELIKCIASAVGCQLLIADTHKANPIGSGDNKGLIDCSLLSQDLREWAYLVCAFEFKLYRKDLNTAVGQLIGRCSQLYEAQPLRRSAFAVAMTLDELLLLKVSCDAQHHLTVDKVSSLSLTAGSTGKLSAAADGIHMLARLLAADKHVHGFHDPVLPVEKMVDGRWLGNFVQVRGAAGSTASVFTADWQQRFTETQDSSVDAALDGGSAASEAGNSSNPSLDGSAENTGELLGYRDFGDKVIVKVGAGVQKEVELLQKVIGLPNIVQMKGRVQLSPDQLPAVILQPLCMVFGSAPSLAELSQLGYDVAGAIQELYKAKIYHQDISRNNIGVFKGRGYLFDFSAAKYFDDEPDQRQSDTGHPSKFTGTPLYAGVCVLEGKPHSKSSDLEALYYSLRHICEDSLPDEVTFRRNPHNHERAMVRRGWMTMEQTYRSKEHEPFLMQLHELFWPDRRYWHSINQEVSVEAFQAVCKKFMHARRPSNS